MIQIGFFFCVDDSFIEILRNFKIGSLSVCLAVWLAGWLYPFLSLPIISLTCVILSGLVTLSILLLQKTQVCHKMHIAD